MQFLGRRNKAQARRAGAGMADLPPLDASGMSEPPRPMGVNEFSALQFMPEFAGGVASLTPEARSMIEWAEGKIKRGEGS